MDASPARETGVTVATGQAEVIAFLASPSTHAGAAVEQIETHASIVFLTGARAFKLKRAVRYDYLDFSTLDRRRAFCEAELRINGRVAPAIYRRVVPVTREPDGHLALGGAGTPVDWVVEMTRFDQDNLLDRLADRGRLELALMRPLATAIAAFHAAAERRFDHGGTAGLRWVIESNAAALRETGGGVLDQALCASLLSSSRAALHRDSALLDRRRADGFVRQCHGDLHLRNVVLLDSVPTLFDAIEFNDEIACVDVLYDLAFLLMDLWRRDLPAHANAVLNGYLSATVDFDGLALLPLFLSCRAAIRAKTSLAAAALTTELPRERELHDLAREYLTAAVQLLRRSQPSIVAVGGFSGTGKSTLASSLAPSLGPVPGAVVLRSDEIRKRLCGVMELSHLGPQGYTAEVSRAVYETLVSHASAIVHAGHTVIVDAVFMDPADRAAVEHAAKSASAPFAGLWLQAAEPVLIERVRRRSADASDAGPAVVRMQCARDAGTIAWDRLDASGDAGSLRAAAAKLLHAQTRDGLTFAA